MGKANVYYLIGRDRKTNEFDVINVGGKRGCSLEDIDLFTTDFACPEEISKKFGRDIDTDYFIAFQKRMGNKKEIKTYEVLYSDNDMIKEIAKNSKEKHISDSSPKIDRILDFFAGQIDRKPVLRERVITGHTNVYEQYAKYFRFSHYRVSSSIKHNDGGWARSSYSLIRNVLDTLGRDTISYLNLSDQMHRELLSKDLFRVTDPGYDPNQYSLFDMFPIEDDSDDKIFEVLGTFEGLDRGVITCEGDTPMFFSGTFDNYEGNDLEILQSSLDTNLISKLQMLLMHRDYLDNSPYPFGESYVSLVERDQRDIVNLLKNDSTVLNNAVEWCHIYKKYDNKVLGDSDGRSYQKRREC